MAEATAQLIREFFLSPDFQNSFADTVANKVSEALAAPIARITQLEEDKRILWADVTKLQQEVYELKNNAATQIHTNRTQAIMQEAGKVNNVVITGLKEEGKLTKETVSTLLAKLNITLMGNFTVTRLGGEKNMVNVNDQNANKSWFGKTPPTTSNNAQEMVELDNPAGTVGKPRPILVKCANTWDKRKLYAARFKLFENGFGGVFINEDLTKQTSELFYKARMAKKSNWIKSCYTEGGILYIKKFSQKVIFFIPCMPS